MEELKNTIAAVCKGCRKYTMVSYDDMEDESLQEEIIEELKEGNDIIYVTIENAKENFGCIC